MRRGTIAALAVLLVLALGALTILPRFLVDWLWFDTLGFGAVFATIWNAKVVVFSAVAALSSLLLVASGLLAVRAAGPPVGRLRVVLGNGGARRGAQEVLEIFPERVAGRAVVIAVAVLLGLLVGLAYAADWETVLRWRYAVPFGRPDPLFGRDLGFYVFTLPLYRLVRDWAFVITFLSAAIAASTYWVRASFDLQRPPRLTKPAIRQLSVLLAAFLVVKAGDYVLQRYGLLFADNGVVFGAAYTDVHLRLPLLTILSGLALVGAALCAANVAALGLRLPVAAVGLLLVGSLIATVVPGVFQRYRVTPDELRLETPYIASNIALTRYGFALDRVSPKVFPAEGTLTPAVLAANEATIQNLRWWDPRPLLDTYRQLQELRLYYDFSDVDVDRYVIDGTYREVMLSARELNQARLAPEAQTWINQHFKFTHGVGLVMSPVNSFDDEGLPLFYVEDIPPVSSVQLPIDRPAIYFGQQTSSYVVVGGDTKEFDYAKGQQNVYTTYEGRAGVPLTSLWRRALFAWHFGDVRLLISRNVAGSSRMLLRRRIQERIATVAPFLRLDGDPYLVVDEGRLIWMQDAYTVSDALPYSRPSRWGGINYIRNAVKVALDAYDGMPVFYVADADDPLVQTYQRIFPSLFQPLDAMPASLRRHVRYPEDLFVLQAAMYRSYHMTDPEVFYNKEDLWSFPQENYGGETIAMQPYYTIMRLPGETREEFILMLPMVPNQRDNMIAWLAARCDGPHYGTVIEFAFPKDKLIFGPAQIEARIDQNTTISQQLSLWNQTGSRVIRGNLLVIPIEDTLLYVEPLYLRAEQRQLPELKRLIAAAGDRVVMSRRTEALLAALFANEEGVESVVAQGAPASTAASGAAPPGGGSTAEARTHYRRALDALRDGDWQGFGTEMDALERALGGSAEPPPAP
jgi:uncharacterized protein